MTECARTYKSHGFSKERLQILLGRSFHIRRTHGQKSRLSSIKSVAKYEASFPQVIEFLRRKISMKCVSINDRDPIWSRSHASGRCRRFPQDGVAPHCSPTVPKVALPKLPQTLPIDAGLAHSVGSKDKDLNIVQIGKHATSLFNCGEQRHNLLQLEIQCRCALPHIGENDESSMVFVRLLREYLTCQLDRAKNVGLAKMRIEVRATRFPRLH